MSALGNQNGKQIIFVFGLVSRSFFIDFLLGIWTLGTSKSRFSHVKLFVRGSSFFLWISELIFFCGLGSGFSGFLRS